MQNTKIHGAFSASKPGTNDATRSNVAERRSFIAASALLTLGEALRHGRSNTFFAVARHTCADRPKSPLRKPLSSPNHSHMLQVKTLHFVAAVPNALARDCCTVFGAFSKKLTK